MFAACSGCLVFLGNDVNFTRDKRMPCDPYGRSYAQNCVNELSPLCLRAQLARQPERACKRERERERGREREREFVFREREREGERFSRRRVRRVKKTTTMMMPIWMLLVRGSTWTTQWNGGRALEREKCTLALMVEHGTWESAGGGGGVAVIGDGHRWIGEVDCSSAGRSLEWTQLDEASVDCS